MSRSSRRARGRFPVPNPLYQFLYQSGPDVGRSRRARVCGISWYSGITAPPGRRGRVSCGHTEGIAMQAITLSADAVAVLRFEIKGWRAKDTARRLPAYRELAAA